MSKEDPTFSAIESVKATLSGEILAGLGMAAVGRTAEANPAEVGMQRIMESLNLTTPFSTEQERLAYLQQMTGDGLIDAIKIISFEKRKISPEENDIGESQIILFRNGNTLETADGVVYLPPSQGLGRALLRKGLEEAQRQGDPTAAGTLLELLIPLTHTVIDGNGASARMYQKLLSEGYDGSHGVDSQYAELMKSRGLGEVKGSIGRSKENYYNSKYSAYLAEAVSQENHLDQTPTGTTVVKWQKDNVRKYPFLGKAGGLGFIEDNFKLAFCIDFIAKTGRNTNDYLLRVDGAAVTYINIEKLLTGARPEENDIARTIMDNHKTRYIHAVIQHFTDSPHPAFQ